MKVSESWLREWVNPPLTGDQLAAQLTMAGLEVDSINPVAGEFNHVVIAEVIKTVPHPQADKLTLCDVNAGNETLYKVVCGASNVRPGLKVALALLGANLPGGMIVKETKLRGELSQGMLCSGSELGLEDSSDGIIELASDAPLGVCIREYLSLNDQVLDIDLTPNRADCFSILGIAREVAALNHLPLKAIPSAVTVPASDESLSIHLSASAACPQYVGRIVRGINPQAETPLWIKERLRRCGLRSLHPVVDVTNYVMLELGQPMHAFDLDTVKGDIHIRFAKKTERLELLNGQEAQLNENVLLIADDEKPLAMAGIMGGEASSVTSQTVDVFLESAFFNQIVIAGVARQFRLSSDSSQRFERGVDPKLQAIALERATYLLQQIVGGKAGPILMVNKSEYLPATINVSFNPSKVQRLSGLEVSKEEMIRILTSLGLTVSSRQEPWQISVPSHRFDISLDVDLVEEIIRMYGYDNISKQPMITDVQPGTINDVDQLSVQVASFLSSRGYSETISYSFVDPELQQEIYPQAQTLQLLNPISQELSQMRAGLWPGLIASMLYNIHRQQSSIKFFEAGVVFDFNNNKLEEHSCIAGLLTGDHAHLNWNEPSRKYDFYDLKGDLQALLSLLGVKNATFKASEHPALHPGKTAQIYIDGNKAGWLGVLHPRILDALDLVEEVVVFELLHSPLTKVVPLRFQSISKYPQIRRDLSLLVEQSISATDIEQTIRAIVPAGLLKSFVVFDVYTGGSIPTGKKSLAVSLTLQEDNRTLVDSEINQIIYAIIKSLNDEFAIILRD